MTEHDNAVRDALYTMIYLNNLQERVKNGIVSLSEMNSDMRNVKDIDEKYRLLRKYGSQIVYDDDMAYCDLYPVIAHFNSINDAFGQDSYYAEEYVDELLPVKARVCVKINSNLNRQILVEFEEGNDISITPSRISIAK